MKLSKIVILSLIFCLVFGFGLNSYAGNGHGSHHGNNNGGNHHNHFLPRVIWNQLTEEQRIEVRETVQEMRANDATREEIFLTVTALLEGYGIELPENWGEGGIHHGNHHGHFLPRVIWNQLTEDQRVEVRETVQEMRANDATREEIRAAVINLLESWGITLPDESAPKSEIRKNKFIQKASNFPNPFNPDTRIIYTIGEAINVKISIFNINGQHVKTLVNKNVQPGEYSAYWDGKDVNGTQVKSGIYFYRIDAGNESISQQMILIK